MKDYGHVTISLDEYNDLKKAEITLDALIESIFSSAELSWDKKELRYSDSKITMVLQAFCKARYNANLRILQQCEIIKEEEKNDE